MWCPVALSFECRCRGLEKEEEEVDLLVNVTKF